MNNNVAMGSANIRKLWWRFGNKLRVKWVKKSALICGVLSLMSDSLIICFQLDVCLFNYILVLITI